MATKIEKKEKIIKTAEKIFLEEGLFNASMDHIAKSAGFTRRTLYRYFDKKEDLAFEVTNRLLKAWHDYQLEVFQTLKGQGLDMLNDFISELIHFMSDQHDLMNYLGEFDFYFKDLTSINLSANPLGENQDIIESDHFINRILEVGIKDGSIKSDLDVGLTEATISQVLWGFGQRIAVRTKAIQKESSYAPLDLIRYQLELYIQALAS